MTTLYDVVVKNRHVEGGNIAVMEFESATSTTLPKVEAGAHIDVHLPNGMVRQYSLCQNPNDEGKFRLGILRDPESRGGSISAFDEIKDGMQIQVSEPKNLFPLLKAKHSVLIGGGIGITPLITMAYQLAHEGESFELHYCGASPEKCAFVDEIKNGELAKHTTFHFKSEGASHRAFFESAIKDIDLESHIYTCGPVGFMDWVINLATTHDFPEQQIHKEYFQVETDTSGDSFEVVAERSGKIIMVEAGETILQALAKEGIDIEMSCEQGVCGTCMCDVIEGEPDHRDVYFTDEEKASNEQILVCCSRSKTPRLVLDI
ncbi:Vanillate O-demethylase oxidoreductase [Acinetobacter pittii]|jgi:vanillate O-demethylase ferredoxin subunit|uniref:PDR/VanB family oxidoreductase n=1 Tax=Acinetobacter TaxID=469 RepID=UPI0001CF74A6|nr:MULTISPECIES: PDR/VanB family oxidoreductase [Acinetobacter]KCY53334.1 2Fe-2S iron-sulfur cluster binding domain protein [Acinetobacter baumannii 1288284]AUT34201.1 oxidoreductase [Acinetobacter pittii]AVN18152.1 oxidoreductase [Acinetobacter pittii]EFF86892.1 2Fe-2S iron-sulfur cluster binding domain protein [Acinetobacter sp. SH024]EKU66953.1 2Fe-2S iron-sulfur cluster-binding domain protein [Acinetobacter pittii]